MQTRIFWLTFSAEADGLWVTIEGRRAGPFPSDLAAEVYVIDVLGRWRARAAALGGHVERQTKRQIVVTLPEGVAFRGGERAVEERRR